jgi:hypothetical protein
VEVAFVRGGGTTLKSNDNAYKTSTGDST